MRTKEMLVALGMVLIAAPATAAGADGKENAASKSATAAQEKKYCIAYDNIVGSRVARQECRTKADWARQGVDVEKLLKE